MGGNEFVVGNRICFNDFDIGYICDRDKTRLEPCKDFEIAVAIYGTILASEDKSEGVKILNRIIVKSLKGYNLDSISRYLQGYVTFYSSSDKPMTSLSLPTHAYAKTNEHIKMIIDRIINYTSGLRR